MYIEPGDWHVGIHNNNMNLLFSFRDCSGNLITSSLPPFYQNCYGNWDTGSHWQLKSIINPLIIGNEIFAGDPITQSSCPQTLNPPSTILQVEMDRFAKNIWYTSGSTSNTASQNIISGSYITASSLSYVYFDIPTLLQVPTASTVIITPKAKNVSWNDSFILGDQLTYTASLNGELTIGLVQQIPYSVVFPGRVRNTEYTIFPSGSNCTASQIVVTNYKVSPIITPQNSANLAYTAQASDARYAFGFNNTASLSLVSLTSDFSVNSQYAVTASYAMNGGGSGGSSLSASYAQTSSYALNATSGNSVSASYLNTIQTQVDKTAIRNMSKMFQDGITAASFTFDAGPLVGTLGLSPGGGYVGTPEDLFDFTWNIDYARELISPKIILTRLQILNISKSVAYEIPSSFDFDSTPDTLDFGGAYYWPQFKFTNLCYIYYKRTNDASIYNTYKTTMSGSLALLPQSNYLANNTSAITTWWWLDHGMGNGYDLFGSLELFLCYTQLSEMASAIGSSSAATTWNTLANNVTASLITNLWDNSAGLYKENTAGFISHSLWGSAYAVSIGAASPVAQTAIVNNFVTHCVPNDYSYSFHGALRRVPVGEKLPLDETFTDPGDHYGPPLVRYSADVLAKASINSASALINDYFQYYSIQGPNISGETWLTGSSNQSTPYYLFGLSQPLHWIRDNVLLELDVASTVIPQPYIITQPVGSKLNFVEYAIQNQGSITPVVSINATGITASNFFGTASYAKTSSFALNATGGTQVSCSWASSSLSASYAQTSSYSLNAAGGNQVSCSWASQSLSASYAKTASYALNAAGGTQVSCSWDSSSLSASYFKNANTTIDSSGFTTTATANFENGTNIDPLGGLNIPIALSRFPGGTTIDYSGNISDGASLFVAGNSTLDAGNITTNGVGNITAVSVTASFNGNGSQITNIQTASYANTASYVAGN